MRKMEGIGDLESAYRKIKKIVDGNTRVFCLEEEAVTVPACISYIESRLSESTPGETGWKLCWLETLIRSAVDWRRERNGSNVVRKSEKRFDLEESAIESQLKGIDLEASQPCDIHKGMHNPEKFRCTMAIVTRAVKLACEWYKVHTVRFQTA